MKKLFSTTVLALLSFSNYGQEAKVTTDKDKYKFYEIVEVTFELNAKYDSISLPDFHGFKMICGSDQSSSVSIQNDEKKVMEARTYRLRPVMSGGLEISSPTYFIDGKRIKGEPAKIKVDASNLTEEELKEKRIQDFIKCEIKPEGTVRVNFYKDNGYIEIFGEKGWQFQRQLKDKEMEQIKNWMLY